MALLPDVVQLVSSYLRSRPAVVELVGERVYTAYPSQLDKGTTFVLVQRIGGTPVLPRPLVIDLAVLQLDAVGGGARTSQLLVATCLDELSRLEGEQPNAAGNVAGVVVGAVRYEPDTTWKPPNPRYVADLSVTVKPSAMVLAGAT